MLRGVSVLGGADRLRNPRVELVGVGPAAHAFPRSCRHIDTAGDQRTVGVGVEAVRHVAVGDGARGLAARLTRMFKSREIGPARLIIYPYRNHELRPAVRRTHPPKPRAAFVRAVRARLARSPRPAEGDYLLAWELGVATRRPFGRWRVLVDAVSGRLVDVLDGLAYATGRGKVFDPNPIVTSGDPGLSSATPTRVLNRQRLDRTLADLDPPGADGKYRLHGAWVQMADFDPPAHPEPASRRAVFAYSSKSRAFLDAMAYFHIDRFQGYLQADLAIENVVAVLSGRDPLTAVLA